jgi:hypothetical protein
MFIKLLPFLKTPKNQSLILNLNSENLWFGDSKPGIQEVKKWVIVISGSIRNPVF